MCDMWHLGGRIGKTMPIVGTCTGTAVATRYCTYVLHRYSTRLFNSTYGTCMQEHIKGMTTNAQHTHKNMHTWQQSRQQTGTSASITTSSLSCIQKSKHSALQQSSQQLQEHKHKHNSRQRINSKHCGMHLCNNCNTRHNMHKKKFL